jgi:membrane fusion protein, multidrug efflux system
MNDADVRTHKKHATVSAGDKNGDAVEPAEAGSASSLASASDRDGQDASPAKPGRRLKVWLSIAAIAIVAIGAGVPYYLYSLAYETTDDAFIDGHVIPISPRVAGHVAKVLVSDNQWVNKGDLLVELDPRDFEAKLAAAEATLKAAQASQSARTIGVDLTEINSSAGVEEATSAVEASKAAVVTSQAAVAAARSLLVEAQAQLPAAKAALQQAQAEVQAAEAKTQRDRSHLKRIEQLVPQHAASEESLSDAEAAQRVSTAELAASRQRVSARTAAVEQAQAAVVSAESNLRQAESTVGAKHASQRGAEAQLAAAQSAPKQVAQSRSHAKGAEADAGRAEAEARQARLNLSYTKIFAPASGHVTRKSVESGAYVQVGQSLLAVVEPDVWIVANFKETQLAEMRPGQRVAVRVDMIPGVKFDAHVDSIQRGSGARFSLLPAENATGNYVKVVQRVPVKIVFDDPKQVASYALGPGMSVLPTVNIGDPGGAAGSETAASR